MKKCRSCHRFKEDYNFYKDLSKKDKIGSYCKTCLKITQEKNIKISELKIQNNKEEKYSKICPRCKIDKKYLEYCKDTTKSDGLQSWCRICNQTAKNETRRSNSVHSRYMLLKHHSKSRDIEFTLSEQEFEKITNERCAYCNEINLKLGIDRIDSTKYYSIDNVVSCCEICNRMKLNHSLNDFKLYIVKIYKNLIEKKILEIK